MVLTKEQREALGVVLASEPSGPKAKEQAKQDQAATELHESLDAHDKSATDAETESVEAQVRKALADILAKAPAGADSPDLAERQRAAANAPADVIENVSNRLTDLERSVNAVNDSRTERRSIAGYDHAEATAKGEGFNIVKASLGFTMGWQGVTAGWEVERDLVHESMVKAQGVGQGSLGGFAVMPQLMMSDPIEYLRAETVVVQAGARVLTFNGGPVSFPKGRGGAQAFWGGEHKTMTETTSKVGTLGLRPKKVYAVSRVSMEFIEEAEDLGQRMVEEDQQMAIGEAIDLGALKGDGGEGQPIGIFNHPDVLATSWSSTVFAGATQNVTEKLDAMEFALAGRNAYRGKLAYIANPLTYLKLRTLKDADGKPILFDAGADTQARNGLRSGSFHGHNFAMTTQLASGAGADLVFGNFDDLMIGRWGAMVVTPSIHASDAFLQDELLIKMRTKVDVGARHAASFQKASSFPA